MGIQVTKEQGVMVSLSTIVAALVALGTAYPVAKTALAGELKTQIKEEIRPLTAALEISTQSSIRQIRTSISALNFKKDMCTGAQGCWTISDQRDLDNATADLATAEAVLKSLQSK